MSKAINTTSQIRPGEHIIMMLHRHWIIFAFKVGYILGLAVTTLVIWLMKAKLIFIFGTAIFWGGLSIYWMLFLTFILLSWINESSE
jgi:hypothetical protein